MLRLECRSGGHNKYYEFDITQEPGGSFVGMGYYGAIGRAPQRSHIASDRMLLLVERAVRAKVSDKLRKGYVEVSNTGWSVGTQPLPPAPTRRPRRRTHQEVAAIRRTENFPATRIGVNNGVHDLAAAEFEGDPLVELSDENEQPNPNAPKPKVMSPTLTIWAMNAQGAKDADHVEELFKDDKYIAQEKIDGMRAVVHVGENGLRIFSRSAGVADTTKPLEKTQSLPHLKELIIDGMAGCVLDAELYIPNATSAEAAGTVNSKEGSDKAVLLVFDLLVMHGVSMMDSKLSVRLGMLGALAPNFDGHEYVHLLPWYQSQESKRNLLDSTLDAGGEGVMFKNLDATYCQGGRPANNWYKCKKSATYDVVIMGFTEGQGKFINGIGAVVFGQYLNGVLTEMGQTSGMTDEVREAMSDDRDMWLGQVFKVGGMERLKSGAIRHPRYLGLVEDKRPQDCIYSPTEQ